MRGISLNRFSVTKTLKNDRTCKTCVAFDRWFQKPDVVVKVFRKALFNLDAMENGGPLSLFAGMRLQHVSPIIETGITRDGDLYLVREYCSGIPAADQGSLEQLRELMSTALFLQSSGFVHGALKPGNVLSSINGIQIMDPRLPGVRTVQESEEDIRFTAPEILKGQEPTLESDLYSIGAFAYRCLTGQHPFEDSELSQLKVKYLWSSVQPIVDNPGVLRTIVRPTIDLLQRNPKKRIAAFRQLAEALQVKPVLPDRAPFVGRSLILDDLLDFIRTDSNGTLKAILVQGEPGIGKSRLIEELKIRCALDKRCFAFSYCGDHSGFEALGQVFNHLIKFIDPAKALDDSLGPFAPTLSRFISNNPDLSEGNYQEQDKISSDFVGLAGKLTRCFPIVLVLEDITEASSSINSFLKHLCLRAAELPIKLICTGRTSLSTSEPIDILRTFLGKNFRCIDLAPLNMAETRRLCYLIQGAASPSTIANDVLDGNPLFMEELAKNATEPTSAIRRAVMWMLSQMQEKESKLVHILSIVQSPVTSEELALIDEETIPVTQERLRALQSIGLVRRSDSSVQLRPEVRTSVLKSMPRNTLVQLSRRAFQVLRDSDHPKPHLARYSFDAGLKSDASRFFRLLAMDALDRQQYTEAVEFFKGMAKCLAGSSLPLKERSMFAWAYHQTGKVGLARRMYREIIASDELQHDGELWSLVQTRLAEVLDRTKPEDRIARHRAAIDSLSPDSSQLPKRYVQLCCSLMRLGDMLGASEALNRAESLLPQNPRVLLGKGLLLANRTEFAAAVQCLQAANQDDAAAGNNLAICYEKLGELGKARELLIETYQKALRTGHVYVEVLALSNLGSVKAKLGDLLESRNVCDEAFARLNRLRSQDQNFDSDLLTSVYADVATHYILSSDYQHASASLRYSRPGRGSIFAFDRISCELVHCEFYARLGQKKQVEARLKTLAENPLFASPFFQIEKNLLESRIGRETPEKMIANLRDALVASEKLGTLYQRCQILSELARVSVEVDREAAGQYAKEALNLARRHGYRLLGAYALLFAGLSAEAAAQKQRYLYGAFQDASEMGLRELIAESAYQIGMFQLSQKNFVTAQEYLMRSISVVEDIADGVPDRFRSSYLALGPHRKALQALKTCNPEVQKLIYVKSISPDFGSEKRYFSSLYQLTVSANSAATADAVVVSVAAAVNDTISRTAVITLKHAGGHIEKTIRTKPLEELLSPARRFIGKTTDRIYLGANQSVPQKPIAWIPLLSAAFEGGIYVVCGPHERSFTEKEIEFLTVVGTIGSSALTALENRKRDDVRQSVSDFHNIIGASKAIKDVQAQIQVAAGNAATVLIEGESGTGKELVARAIHETGSRSNGKFMPIDCGALPESLIEAELFGARKGSYTGADADRPGLFEAAHGGTLFLDEISNTTPALQAKLLRVIQEREVRRIGDTKSRPVDVRLIAATNQSLDALAADGRFRKDLLYRLKVLNIKVPPLRNRRDDIPMLAHSFLQKLNAVNKTKKYFAPGVLDRLSVYNFPGNVRELQNATERAFFTTRGTVIGDIPLEALTQVPAAGDDVQSWFSDLSEGRKDFWSAVHNKYKRRDISREKVVALVDFGLRSTRGNYKKIASMFRLKGSEYRRFMDFLRRNDCLLDFRPYRKLADASSTEL